MALCTPQIPHDLTWGQTQDPRYKSGDQPSQLWHGRQNSLISSAWYLSHDGFLVGSFFDTEDGGSVFLATVC
jgi:hypothetical protein